MFSVKPYWLIDCKGFEVSTAIGRIYSSIIRPIRGQILTNLYDLCRCLGLFLPLWITDATEVLNYEESLKMTGLENLKSRQKSLCLTFAKKCLNNPKMVSLFPLNPGYNLNSRKSEKYQVNFAHNNRFKYSAIPALQRLLNEDNK